MKKALLPLFAVSVCGLLLSSCSALLPAPTPPPTADPKALETRIAEGVLLTSFPITQAAAETHAAETVIADLTQAASPPPTDTPAPTDTLVPTNTPEPSHTPTTVVPTLDPANPKAGLGDPDFRERFDSATNWAEFNTDQARMQIKDGEMHFTIKQKNTASRWAVTWLTAQDYYMEVKAHTPATCTGKDRYGIFFRAPEVNKGYLLMLTCDGTYTFVRWDGTNWDILIPYTYSEHIKQGADKTNVVAVYAVGNQYEFYANDKLLGSFSDNTYVSDTRFGLIAGSTDTDNLLIRFDDLTYWDVP